MSRRAIVLWSIVVITAAVIAIAAVWRVHRWRQQAMTIRGVVIRRDTDTRRQLPISDAIITVTDGTASATAQSDASGYFDIRFPRGAWPGQRVKLNFKHPDYEALNATLETILRPAVHPPFVAAMKPLPQPPQTATGKPLSVISNIRIRYTINSQSEQNIGSAVRTFQVVNKGGVPCAGKPPCSPDGRWKGATASISLDAGSGNEFRNIRASCIAGPCPFTRIDTSGFVAGGRNITVSATNWSDTATFLVEAEVFHDAINSNVRESFPVVFGRALNFTLPLTQEGVSIEAELDGAPMVFPLGPELYLSWATCTERTNTEGPKNMAYRCELKPDYRF